MASTMSTRGDGGVITAVDPTHTAIIYTSGLGGVNNFENLLFSEILFYCLTAFAGILLGVRLSMLIYAQARLVLCLSTSEKAQQSYWAIPQTGIIGKLKKHILYAPLWRKRHNDTIMLKKWEISNIPTRIHATVLLIYIASNVCYCTLLLDWGQPGPAKIAEFRGRTGVMAVVNMVPLFLLAGRNNPLIGLLKISFDSYNLLHRWMGRIVVVESIAHTIAYMINNHQAFGWSGIASNVRTKPFITYGLIAVCAFVAILFLSPKPFRASFYETFLHVHILLAVTAVVTVYMHLQTDKLPQLIYLQIAIVLWAFDRSFRLGRLCYRNVGKRMTTATFEALPEEATRVTIHLARPWTFSPGSHVYIYVPGLSLWQSHPFSVAWSEETPNSAIMSSTDDEKMDRYDLDLERVSTKRSISLVIGRREGFTRQINDKAINSPEKTFTMRALVEGPYGVNHCLRSYGTVILFAGGSGITHQIPYVRDLVHSYAENTCATRRILLVWVIRTTGQLEWVRPWMNQILAMDKRREVLRIQLYITRPKSKREIQSPSDSVTIQASRPNHDVILDKEIASRHGAMAVTVCGPGGLQDSVRSVVRQRVNVANLDFIEESFTW